MSSSDSDDTEVDPGKAPAVPLARRIGFWVGALAFLVFLATPPPDGITSDAWRAAAVCSLMAAWWISEALPIAVTAMVPLCAIPLLGIGTFKAAAQPFAHPIIFLFLGGFIIALAMERWNLHRRIALQILARAGTNPSRVVGGFMLATAALSMWVSNTATAMMMLPIGVSVIELLGTSSSTREEQMRGRRFAVALMLGIAYGANIGGIGTTVGTFPNALLVAFVEEQYQLQITMLQWMAVGLPLVAVMLPLTWWLLCKWLYPTTGAEMGEGQKFIEYELKRLGPMAWEEKIVGAVFVLTALAWCFRPVIAQVLPDGTDLKDGVIAILAAIVLFIVPSKKTRGDRVMNWAWAKKLPWELPLLIGGGLSLASVIKVSGLSALIGESLGGLASMPVIFGLVVFVGVIIFLTEITSNTATTAVFLPILGAFALTADQQPLMLLFPATIAASCAFMLPVATPPNAIVYGSRRLQVAQMVRAGIVLNVLAWGLLCAFGYFLLPRLY